LYAIWRKWLFRLDPETAHEWTIRSLQAMQSVPAFLAAVERRMCVMDDRLAVRCWNRIFPNPVGLAAGFDKHAGVYPALAAFGFGSIEVGTLTPRPQPGNPKPRLFRLPEDEAIINRMGFNNSGIEHAARSFVSLPRPAIPIGINLGKNKEIPNEKAANDYRIGLRTLYRYGDYFVINISSPNTQGLRDLQQVNALDRLLAEVMAEKRQLQKETGEERPILLKVAPDMPLEMLSDMVRIGLQHRINGFIATNTTLTREGLKNAHAGETGGLSGKPLRRKSTEFIRHIYRETEGSVPIIGVGGIFTGEDAYEKIRAGARLVQVYTGMIYRGPGIAREINQTLIRLLERDGLNSIEAAVGADV
jgi:dihydroorotate dehydrogenase